MFESQLKTVSLLHPSVPQVPLFLHPEGLPLLLFAHVAQPIYQSIFGSFKKLL
jgi:hypothetical protein